MLSLRTTFPTFKPPAFTDEWLDRYADAARDPNPIHLDTIAAKRAGFAGRPVQGILLAAQIERALAAWLPQHDVTRLTVTFLAPVLSGEVVRVDGRVVSASLLGECVLRLVMRNTEDRLVVVGDARIRNGG